MSSNKLPYNSEETAVIIEALYNIRNIKQEAMKILTEEIPHRHWSRQDFGLPTIDKLIKQFEDHEETIDV